MKNSARNASTDTAASRLAPPSRDEFAKAAYDHLKSIKAGLPDSVVESMADAKTARYAEAVKSTDEAIALLHAVAADLSAEAKTELEDAVGAVTDFVMFNGEASMAKNSHWDGEGGEYTG